MSDHERTYSTPLSFPTAEGGYLLRSEKEANALDRVLEQNNLTESMAKTMFADLDGPSVLNRLLTSARTDSHQRKVGRPASNGQRHLVALYRLAAIAQGKRGVVRQIDTFIENEGVLADMARWSAIIDGLKVSGVLLPEDAQDQSVADSIAEITAQERDDTSGDVFGG